MKFAISLFIVAVLYTAAVSSKEEKVLYEGYKLLRLYPTSQEQIEFVHELEDKDREVDIWTTVLVGERKSIDVMLSPSSFAKYSRVFASKGIQIELLIENIQTIINAEAESMAKSRENRNSILFKYARYNEMMDFIEDTVDANTDIAKSEVIGLTENKRQLKVIKLRSGNPTKSVWIDCGIHAREWVSPSTCIYIINTLIDEFRDFNPVVVDLFKKYEFHILPTLNPDGYEYSHQTARLWRKNLRNNNNNDTCNGVDLNRNFPYEWMQGGASDDACSETYAGPRAQSELETNAVIDYINNKTGEWESFLSIHSYGCWWLTPYGHSTTLTAPDQDLIMAAASVGVKAIKDYNGTVFTAGPSSQLLYIHSGLSPDWAYATKGIRYSHVIELRPGKGTPEYIYGFLLPENRMPSVATETYVGIKAYLHYISQL